MEIFQNRVIRAQKVMQQKGIDYLLLAPSANMYYLTGLRPTADERLQVVVVPGAGKPTAILAEMYRAVAEKESRGSVDLLTWADDADPVALVQTVVVKEKGLAAVDEKMWTGHFLKLMKVFCRFDFLPAADVIKQLRMIKDQQELAYLRAAGEIADQAIGAVIAQIKPGISELGLAMQLENKLKEMGATGSSFSPIVAFGENGASPHHQTGHRQLAAGELVTMDFGGLHQGYCSDMTRTVCLGKANPEMKQVYQAVKAANEAGFQAARLGNSCADVDRAARQAITVAGFGGYFIHRTGHGIGLDVHEEPYMVAGNELPLEIGMTFSIEPGIYLPGKFGVRIEDIVGVTENEPVRLNNYSRELMEL